MSLSNHRIKVLIAAYLISFAMLHSFLASRPAKRLAWLVFGPGVDRLYMKAFNQIAVVTLMPLLAMLLLFPGKRLYVMPSPRRWLMIAGQIMASSLISLAFKDGPQRFSVSAQMAKPGSPKSKPLAIRGIYCWVRDPFLLSGLLSLWLTPFMFANQLLIYVLTSVYLILGSLHWEKRLISQFGSEYIEYKHSTPRVIPWNGNKCGSRK